MTDAVAPEPANLRLTLTRQSNALVDRVRRVWAHKWGRRGVVAALALVVLYVLIWALFLRGLPDARALLRYEPPLPTNVRGIDGTPVYAYARERRVQLSFEEYPKRLVEAYMSAEDKNFFSHGGVDYLGLVRAVIQGIANQETPRGTSTITQQVAKNLLIGNEVSYTRKLKEAVLAYRIEDALTKEQIMELYLNQIALGRNAFGVQSAARAYFGKDVGELALHEMAYLAILPKGPSNYRPERFYDRAIERRNWVLGQMVENGHVNEAERAAAAAMPLGTIARAAAVRDEVGGYFTEEVRRQLMEKFGETAQAGPYSVYAGGLWVRTSLDQRLQVFAQDALRGGLIRFEGGRGWSGPVAKIDIGSNWKAAFGAKNTGISYRDWRTAVVIAKSEGVAQLGFLDGTEGALPSYAASMPRRGTGSTAFAAMQPGDVIVVAPEGNIWSLRSVPEISGGFVAQNPLTGQVVAMQGGFDVRLSSFNRATQAMRQPGSSFKPFAYASALDNGMTPASIVVDGPFCVYQGARYGQKCFRNFGGTAGAGPQTLRWGIEQSRNLMTVRLASQTGMDNVVKLADAVGISPPGRPYQAVLAVALGAGETTVERMVNAYSILAANGRATTPTVIDFVQDRNGKVIQRADTRPCERCNLADYDGKPMPRPPARTKQVMDAMTAYQMVHITEGVIQRGTATTLRDLNRPVFGKTGTTSGPRDVWFVGGTPNLVAGVYLGYDTPRDMGGYVQGGTIAAPIWKAFAKPALEGMPVVPFRAPAGVRMVRIERKSGKRVYGVWPSSDPKSPIIWEAFKPESEPRRSIREEELPVAVRPKAATRATQQQSRGDSDFLQRQGGIY
jgi:penicillin-binding protein 1A